MEGAATCFVLVGGGRVGERAANGADFAIPCDGSSERRCANESRSGADPWLPAQRRRGVAVALLVLMGAPPNRRCFEIVSRN